jgi:S-disulfanyl-L-cysteine oxidoreductase SoxD
MRRTNRDGKAGRRRITFSPVITHASAVVAGGIVLLGVAFHVLPAADVHAAATAIGRSGSPRSVWDSVYTDIQARRGDTVYRALCVQCHGETLAGFDDAPQLAGREFLAGWSGLTVGRLYGRIQRTMPEDDSAVLTPNQIADVVAYILSSNGFPAGRIELGVEPAALAEIRIDSMRPRPDSGSTHESRRGNR